MLRRHRGNGPGGEGRAERR